MPGQIVGITGHRPDKLGGWKPCPEWDLIHHNIRNTLIALQPRVLLTGMALGVDQWAAEIALQLGIPFVAFVPFQGYETKWPDRSQVKYNWLLTQAHQTVIVCEVPGYAPWKLHQRNRWLVDKCELLLAVYNGTPGGTQSCLAYATQVHRQIQYIPIGFPSSAQDLLGAAASQFIAPDQPTQQRETRQEQSQIVPRITRIIEE